MAEAYFDLHKLPEDERIIGMGETVMRTRKTAAVVTDDRPKDKAERYKAKLRARFPGLVIGPTMPGPVKGSVWFRIAPPPAENN